MGHSFSLLVVGHRFGVLQRPELELLRAAKGRILESKANSAHPHPTGSCFLRTDQLDGETDWKLRLPVACTQRLPTAAVSSFPAEGQTDIGVLGGLSNQRPLGPGCGMSGVKEG